MISIMAEGAIRGGKENLTEANSRLATASPEEKVALQSTIDELKMNLARAEGMVQGYAETFASERKQWEEEKWAGYGKRSVERPIIPVRTPPPSLSAAGLAAHGDFWARVDARGKDIINKLKLLEIKMAEYRKGPVRSAKLTEQMKAAAAEERTLWKASLDFDKESKAAAAVWNARNWAGYEIPDAFPEKPDAAPPPSPSK